VTAAALWPERMRRDRRAVFWGAVVGLAVASGWAGTSWVAQTGFAAVTVQSHTFARPLGDTLVWLMLASGLSAGFAVGSVAGVLVGAFVGSTVRGHFRWEACEDPRELRRQIGGAALMGVGAVLAGGCTVGQGLSAAAVLAWSAPLVAGGIILGGVLGLRQLIAGLEPAE